MTRALSLTLMPVEAKEHNLRIETYTYDAQASAIRFSSMCENVFLDTDSPNLRASVTLTPDEARVLANQLMQVADQAEEARDRRVSFEQIQEELNTADEHGLPGTGCLYAHPDVHYVPAGQLAAKTRELDSAGCRQYIVLAEPEAATEDAKRPA